MRGEKRQRRVKVLQFKGPDVGLVPCPSCRLLPRVDMRGYDRSTLSGSFESVECGERLRRSGWHHYRVHHLN
eukprot:9712866-Prorocentrum_lima.AAC.1